jgi:PadR family transcriptional regulator, regulatory protein AphA
MAKSNKSKFAIMGMLALVPKSSGYDIKKLMEGSTQYFWKESFSSIYPVLGTLIEEGLISQHEDLSKSGRQRNLYELTETGKKELQEWISKPVEYEQFRNELLLKLFFGKLVPPSTTRKHIKEFHQMLIEKDKIYQSIRNKLQLDHKGQSGLPYWLMTLDFGLKQVKSALEWCESALNLETAVEDNKLTQSFEP